MYWSQSCRQRDLYNDQVDQLAEVEDYGEEGHSSILYLLLEASNVDNEKTEYAASHVGVCSAIVTLLKAMPFQLAQVSMRSTGDDYFTLVAIHVIIS
jgi:hypothetical protein